MNSDWKPWLLAAVVSVGVVPSSHAIILLDGADSAHTMAPLDDPGFARVGQVGVNGSGVYLGNGWVLTANHVDKVNESVSPNPIFVVDGVSYEGTGASHRLTNPGELGLDATYTDLFLFQVSTAGKPLAGVELLEIRETPVSKNTTGLAIGTGRGQVQDSPRTWYIDEDAIDGEGETYWEWYDQPVEGVTDFTRSGYEWAGTASRAKRWGEMTLNSNAGNTQIKVALGSTETRGFAVPFTNPGSPTMVAEFDSGSPFFVKTGGDWQLAGIAHLVNPGSSVQDQPAQTSIFGNFSVYSDLSFYADQINGIVPEPASLALFAAGMAMVVGRPRKG